MIATGREEEVVGWHDLDDIVAELAETMPVFAPLPEIAPPAEFRLVKQKVPREPHRHSGRTANLAHITVHEPKPPDDPDSAMAFSMEGFKGMPPPALQPRYWAPGWNSVQALNKFQDEVGGPLRGGDPGRRLIEPTPGESVSYFGKVPAAFRAGSGRWLVVPLYHIFGSEELSIHTPGVAERAPQPYLALNPADADSLGVNVGDAVKLHLAELTLDLPLRLEPSLPQGLVGMPVGLPDTPAVALPVWSQLSPGAGGEEEEIT
jgi:NADH-quinone oxidoreductase subunit G